MTSPTLFAAPVSLCIGLSAGAALMLGPASPRDLDVAVPAGSPLEWSRSFPAFSPGRSPFSESPRPSNEEGERSQVREQPRRLDVRSGSAQSLVRVLTWDLAAHVTWIGPDKRGPSSGAPRVSGARSEYGEALYWLTLAPLLRLLLHPADLSRFETHAHLVEFGAVVEGVLAVAALDRGLRDDVDIVRALVAAPALVQLPATVGESGRERMLSRFTMEGLLRDHPYDPEGAFGRELFLFPDQIFPHLVRYARADHPYLRRNAVAALARFETRPAIDALVQIVVDAKDPVVMMRALAALGRFHGPLKPLQRDALLAHLEAARGPVERAALIGALARAQVEGLLPVLFSIIAEALEEEDGELLLTALSARTEYRRRKMEPAEMDLLQRVESVLVQRPKRFRPKGPLAEVRADASEQLRARAKVLRQLGQLLRVRLDPTDAELRGEFLALLQPDAVRPGAAPPGQGFRSSSLGSVAPVARYAYIETLRRLGDEGVGPLKLIAGDGGVEDGLRVLALIGLPYAERMAIVDRLFFGAGSRALRASAFEWLVRESDPKAVSYARTLLEECAALHPGGGDAATRHLYTTALRYLSNRGDLHAVDLAPLLPHVRAEQNLHGDLSVTGKARIEQLVRAAAAGEITDRLKPKVDELLEFLREHGARPVLEGSVLRLRSYVLGALIGVRKHPTDGAYHRNVVADLALRLMGLRLAVPNRDLGEFEPRVLLEEEILLALGRTRETEATELLLQLLNEEDSRLRAHICLAIGMTGTRSASKRLARLLLDKDAFVRFAAHESLRHLTGKSIDVDWMYASSRERFSAAEEYWGWLNTKR